MNFVDQIENLNPAKCLRPSSCEIKGAFHLSELAGRTIA